MKRSIYFLFIILSFFSCDCEEHETLLLEEDIFDLVLLPYVVEPAHLSDITYDYCAFSTSIIVTLVFSEPINTLDFTRNNLRLIPNENNTGYLEIEEWTWSEDATRLDIYMFFDDCNNCIAELSLLNGTPGFDVQPILSNSGFVLDGNKNNTEGGDYTMTLRINETPTYIVSPPANQTSLTEGYTILDNTKMQIDIQFSQPMDTLTANDESVVLTSDAFGTPIPIPLTFSWDETQTVLTITSQISIYDNCTAACPTTLRINGIGVINPLKDDSDIILDGNFNCDPGGLFITQFYY